MNTSNVRKFEPKFCSLLTACPKILTAKPENSQAPGTGTGNRNEKGIGNPFPGDESMVS